MAAKLEGALLKGGGVAGGGQKYSNHFSIRALRETLYDRKELWVGFPISFERISLRRFSVTLTFIALQNYFAVFIAVFCLSST